MSSNQRETGERETGVGETGGRETDRERERERERLRFISCSTCPRSLALGGIPAAMISVVPIVCKTEVNLVRWTLGGLRERVNNDGHSEVDLTHNALQFTSSPL